MYQGGASMYASAAPASIYAPATTAVAASQYVAAPTTTAVAAPTVAAPSYVAPVANYPGFGVPQPQSLTAGLVPPPKVQQEAAAYHKAIDGQLAKQSGAVYEEAKIKQQMMQQQAKTQIEQYRLQVEEKLAMDCLRLIR